MVTPEEHFGDRPFTQVELEYTLRQVQFFLVEQKGMSEEDSEVEPEEGWRGVYSFAPEFPTVEVEGDELLFVYKPLNGPYIELSMCILIQDEVFRQNVKDLVELLSRHGVSLAIESGNGPEPDTVTLQLTLRLFSVNLSPAVFEMALENLVTCKGALIEYLISIGAS